MVETSLFIDFMGDSPMIRVIDYLITERELDFSLTDIALNSKIGRATLYRILNSLFRNNIILYTRNVGNAKLYKLNLKNQKIKKLIEIYDELILDELKIKSNKKGIEIIA